MLLQAVAAMMWEAIIKVNVDAEHHIRKRDIIDGLGYACAILHDEYGVSADEIAATLERITDDVYDDEAMRR